MVVLYLCLFCKILLERACFSKIAVFFCVARENLRPRHAVNFSMPCACRGVKIFDVSCAFQGGQGMSIILTIMVPVSRHDI